MLVVDDHECVRQGVSAILSSRMDIEVSGEAVNGQEAIEKAKELRPDLILLDVTMPVPKIVHPPPDRCAGFPTVIPEQSLKQRAARNSSGLSFACFLADAGGRARSPTNLLHQS
jgi:chemotaxis response regulator CheB